jgi:hypothetical protein
VVVVAAVVCLVVIYLHHGQSLVPTSRVGHVFGEASGRVGEAGLEEEDD